VTEAISPVGDVDEYHFNANKGDSVGVTFRATSGSGDNVLRLSLLRGDRTPVFSIEAAGGQPDQSKALKLPQSDNYIIRVQGVNSTDDGGSYRFQVVKLN